ncbi:unnamed protein product [Clavelina lepadiformis]|uniref:Uncharacterized protein n=1 Tax=Clavelina lepadiformis TaxID=159417 RepID=A0ABP0GYV2_CLALP
MGISTAAGQERALSYLKPLCTYILMEKRVIPAVRNFPIMISNASTSQSFSRSSKSKTNETEFSTNETCKDLYFPLLLGVNKIYPDFHFHKTIPEKNTFNQRKSKGSKYVCGQSVNHLGISQLKSMSTTSRKSITSVKTLPKRIYSNYARRLTLM